MGGALARRPLPLLPLPLPFFFWVASSFSSSSSSSSSSASSADAEPDRQREGGTLLGAYVDECGWIPGSNGIDAAQINVTDHASVVWTVYEELNELPVLQNRDPRFARAALMRISLFIVAVSSQCSATRRAKQRTVQKSPRGRLQGAL